ncbi:MAG: hypothetical protein L7F77_13195, partial [Candidatus Magnetominusculus sp. LBB02]|nr:hypothetical protein [Candidatus Magnetominusculus sp. LBB02]
MKEVNKLHNEAMDYAQDAFHHRQTGDTTKAKECFLLAFGLERKAAELFKDSTLEPTRSVLYRSAASLAYNCDELREAERLVSTALSGDPPDEIADELRNLLEDINFKRHLIIHDIEIDSSMLQLSIAGEAVGYGKAKIGDFIPRIQNTEKILNRTYERMCGLPFRKGGRTKKTIRNNAYYMSVPKAASLSVTITIGTPTEQQDLFHPPQIVVDEVLECLELSNGSDLESLKKRINDKLYYHNFIGLSKQIAPDGENIKLVGFTVIRNGIEKMVSLKKKTDFIMDFREETISSKQEVVTVTGRLLYADSIKKQEIKLKDKTGKVHIIKVPESWMDDIVRPLWNNTVTVTGHCADKGIIILKDIQ